MIGHPQTGGTSRVRAGAMMSVCVRLLRLSFGVLAVVGCSVAGARAQDDSVVDEKLEIDRPINRAAADQELQAHFEAQRQRLRAVYQSQFERWVVTQFKTQNGPRQQLELQLAARVRRLTLQCRLTDEQARKLEVAGRGDIKRFMDRFESVANALKNPKSKVEELRAARGEMHSLGMPALARLFGEDSLLQKTLVGTLDPGQSAAYQKAMTERNKNRHEAVIESAVKTIQDNLGLSERQRDRLKQVLLAETRPPRKFGDAPDVVLVLFQASRINDDRLKPIFDDGQWRVFQHWMSVYLDRPRAQEALAKRGFVLDDESGAGVADRKKAVTAQNGQQRPQTE